MHNRTTDNEEVYITVGILCGLYDPYKTIRGLFLVSLPLEFNKLEKKTSSGATATAKGFGEHVLYSIFCTRVR